MQAGTVTSFVAQLPPVYCSSSTRIAYLTALREVAITDIANPRYRCSFDADGEPSLLAVADHGLAMAWGNKVDPVPARTMGVCSPHVSRLADLHACRSAQSQQLSPRWLIARSHVGS